MKKYFLSAIAVIAIAGCKSSKPESKYDFSNVQSISTEGMEPSVSPNHIMKDTIITVPLNDPLQD
jgi:uncharacterized protein YcfL